MDAHASFLRRLSIYQKERFPLLGHGPLIAAFSFSAIGYSRLCRGAAGFVPLAQYAACVLTNFAVFFLLRVSDEYKDKDNDATHRQYLPVARGLISLGELRNTAAVLIGLAVLVNIFYYPALLPLLGVALLFLLLMRYEFFAGAWLHRHVGLYMLSHMFIIPLTDMYASSYDWKLNRVPAPAGLLAFFGVSYLNGMVLEVGRKLRIPEQEEPGVDSYTRHWGLRAGPAAWLLLLTLNFGLACQAVWLAQGSSIAFITMSVLYILTTVPAIGFLLRPTAARGKAIELASYVWALAMYLAIGGIPQLWQLIAGQ